MECHVVRKDLVRVDGHGGCLRLNGKEDIRILIKKLNDALFEIRALEREEVCNDSQV